MFHMLNPLVLYIFFIPASEEYAFVHITVGIDERKFPPRLSEQLKGHVLLELGLHQIISLWSGALFSKLRYSGLNWGAC